MHTEQLEQRRLLSASIDELNSILTVTGTSADDVIVLTRIEGTPNLQVMLNGEDLGEFDVENLVSIDNEDEGPMGRQVRVFGQDGHDQISYEVNGVQTTPTVLLFGDAGDDTISGGDGGSFQLYGRIGDDELIARTGGSDATALRGGKGSDLLTGSGSDDFLNGHSGDDTLVGAGGDDLMNGGLGNDSIDGGFDNDTIHGRSGDDTITAGDGQDSINPGIGLDVINGEVEPFDILTGTAGDDEIIVAMSADGEKFTVTMNGVQTHEEPLEELYGTLRIRAGDGNDIVMIDDTNGTFEVDLRIFGERGDDTITGGSNRRVTLHGGGG